MEYWKMLIGKDKQNQFRVDDTREQVQRVQRVQRDVATWNEDLAYEMQFVCMRVGTKEREYVPK